MFILKKGHLPGVYMPLRALFLVQFCVPFIQFIHLSWNELVDSACLISAGRLFQIRGPG